MRKKTAIEAPSGRRQGTGVEYNDRIQNKRTIKLVRRASGKRTAP